jgi:PAS domain S-box-containing protein
MLDVSGRREAESKAAAAENRFRTLAERGPVVVFSFELIYAEADALPTVSVVYISPQAAELVRYPIEHWLRESEWLEMVHPDDREDVARTMQRSGQTGEPWTLHYRMIRSDGAVIWVLDTGGMLQRDSLGRPSTFQGILLDITEDEGSRAKLEQSEREQRQALEGALVVPWTETIHPGTGAERYTYIGPQSLELLGYTPEELKVESTHFPRMVHPDDRARIRESVTRAGETGLWEDTYRVLRRDGEVRWLHSIGRRVSPAGEVPELWHGIAVDVSAMRAMDEVPANDAGAERRRR